MSRAFNLIADLGSSLGDLILRLVFSRRELELPDPRCLRIELTTNQFDQERVCLAGIKVPEMQLCGALSILRHSLLGTGRSPLFTFLQPTGKLLHLDRVVEVDSRLRRTAYVALRETISSSSSS